MIFIVIEKDFSVSRISAKDIHDAISQCVTRGFVTILDDSDAAKLGKLLVGITTEEYPR